MRPDTRLSPGAIASSAMRFQISLKQKPRYFGAFLWLAIASAPRIWQKAEEASRRAMMTDIGFAHPGGIRACP